MIEIHCQCGLYIPVNPGKLPPIGVDWKFSCAACGKEYTFREALREQDKEEISYKQEYHKLMDDIQRVGCKAQFIPGKDIIEEIEKRLGLFEYVYTQVVVALDNLLNKVQGDRIAAITLNSLLLHINAEIGRKR